MANGQLSHSPLEKLDDMAMATTSFFSRAHRVGVPASKKIRGFLALPGEIRNHIYSYYFNSVRRCEIVGRGAQLTQRTLQTVKLSLNLVPANNTTSAPGSESNTVPLTVVRFSRPLGKYNIVQGLQTNWQDSLHALSLVCKQIYTETVTFLYQKTIFVFDAPKRMENFFKFASSIGIGNIAKLHLHYNTYGHPYRTESLIWQERHSQSWQRGCKAASKKLTGLQELEIWMQVHEAAPKFSLREKWLKPLLHFRRLAYTKELASHDNASSPLVDCRSGLQTAKVNVETYWSRNFEVDCTADRGLVKASRDLHQLYGQAISLAITGSTEEAAMAGFDAAWKGKHAEWRNHLPLVRRA
ncbi:hypothetical protein G6011_01637 [Alternaria panax]|uniref:DUF7730 domain-containing protein n=1 Tax=Alternaria panax TaxID=48097 RepID=A0AAD4ILB7_9PLEO|nr:hypothetical protein G6011_01637 [Alternaria panax]